jgi:diguanylate cyclase (GGDEF)-like protein
MAAALERAGFEAYTAVDGEDALRKFRDEGYDLVMLDVEMPRVSGFDVCAALRAEAGEELPIVMVTGHDDFKVVEQAFDLGATDFISKPINWGLIGHRLRYLLRGRQLLEDLQRNEWQLTEAQRIARIGSWELDAANSRVVCSQAMCAMFELPAQEDSLAFEHLLQRVHPEDLDRARRAFVGAAPGESTGGAHVYRLRLPDGRVKHIRQEAEPRLIPGRVDPRIVGTVQDITEQHITQNALASLATTLSTLSGTAFHHAVSKHLVEALGLDIAFVGRLERSHDRVRIIAGCNGAEPLKPFTYALAGTPCANVFERGNQILRAQVQGLFPADELLVELGIESYIGVPIFDKGNTPIGILVALGKRPLDRPGLADRLLGIFGGPVGAEMLRAEAESAAVRLSEYRQMILELSTGFIRMRPDELDRSIDHALARMAEFFHADRAYIFGYDFVAGTTSNTHEWCGQGISTQMENLQDLPLETIDDMVATHRKGEPVVVADVGALPPGPLREMLAPQDIKSLITSPMMFEDDCLGFVGFDAVRKVVEYGADEIELLGLFAGLLVNVETRRRAEQALHESGQMLEQAQSVARLGSWFYDLAADELHWSAETHRIFDVPEGIRLNYEGIMARVHPDDRAEVEAAWEAALSGGELRIEHRILVGDEVRWVYERAKLSRDPDGNPIAGIGTVQDITERKQHELAVVEARNKLRNTLEAIPDLLFEIELPGRIVDCHLPERTGLVFRDLVGASLDQVFPAEAAAVFSAAVHDAYVQGSSLGNLVELETADGPRWFELSASRKSLASPGSASFVVLARDVTSRREAEQKVYRLAYFDPLTGLPNRLSFSERLEREIYRARRGEEKLAILFLDLDGFKNINDTMGHGTGDLLLQWVSDRLRLSVRPADVVARVDSSEEEIELARLGGDEFTVLVPHLRNAEEVLGVAHRIHEEMRRPFRLEGRDVVLTTSIGISVFPDDGQDGATLLKHADTAMYHAKDQGRDNCQFYSASLTQQALHRLDLENNLRRALQRDEFFLVYQPQFDLVTGRVESVEALIRWQHPEHDLISPLDFIPAAEENGLIVPIGEWVMRQACADAKRWEAEGLSLRVAVNLSARQFRDPDLAERIGSILAKSGLSADRMELEVTEGSLMEDTEATLATLNRLTEIGLRLSLDDFGTGYSSLSYLKRLPLNNVKVDRSFVRGLPLDHDNLAIVRAIVSLARNLGFTVTAEGVETVEQARCLRDLACDTLQGYFIGRPVGADEVSGLIRQFALDTETTRVEAPVAPTRPRRGGTVLELP